MLEAAKVRKLLGFFVLGRGGEGGSTSHVAFFFCELFSLVGDNCFLRTDSSELGETVVGFLSSFSAELGKRSGRLGLRIRRRGEGVGYQSWI